MPPYVYIARHGETEPNRLHYVQSQTIDEPLNAIGREQAKKLGQRLKNENIRLMFVSPAKRTIETAAFIIDAIVPPNVYGPHFIHYYFHYYFLEINCGQLDGTPYAELREKFPGLFTAWWGISGAFNKHRFPFPDGESFNQIVARAKKAVNYMRATITLKLPHPNDNVLIVGHGSMNTVITALLLNLSPEVFFSALRFENCSLIKIDLDYHGIPRLIAT